ncbi:winged helix-turn-helix domain-containing protein [Amycolatopsis sp. NPDC051128]|uniref:winged helix-turn-helix domain-containing protein n=1 Tax=Amycolatopsis sp. NPDC051128 TaxID=3155412 RepID=UPI00343C3E4E
MAGALNRYTHMFTEAGRWRIDALAPGQRAQLTAATKSAPTGRDVRQVTPADRAILAHLAQDGRASHQALATALKTSASTVKRHIDQLVGLGLLSFRCDFARGRSGSAGHGVPSRQGEGTADVTAPFSVANGTKTTKSVA